MAELSPRITAKLKQIPAVAVDAARVAMEEGAEEVCDYMRQLVPKRQLKLMQSIGWTWGDLPPGSFMIDDIRSGSNRGMQYATLRIKIYVGSKEAFYARFVEFGTQAHSLTRNASVARGKRQGAGKGHPGTAAQPFFFPAWKAKKPAFQNRIRSKVRAAIKEAWRNG